MSESLKDCIMLFISFFKIGVVTFGGGYTMLPILEDELIKRRGWIDRNELIDYFTMSQTLPGIIAVNMATFCGTKRRGFLGGLAASLGVITPSIIMIILIASFIGNFSDIPAVQRVMRGMNVAVAALLTDSLIRMGRAAIVDPLTAFLAAGAFLAVIAFDISSVLILVIAIVVGLIVKRRGGNV